MTLLYYHDDFLAHETGQHPECAERLIAVSRLLMAEAPGPFQIVDDILDVSGNEEVSGKTLGKDQERGKTTAITATKGAPDQPRVYIDSLLHASSAQLAAWPALQTSWNDFLALIIEPVLNKHLSAG